MADEKMDQEETSSKKKKTKEEKKLEREEKKKAKKNGKEAEETDEEEEEKAGSKVVIAFVTLLILLIWLGIIAILIKCDVGGFGSSVLYPLLKDVPYVNRILPAVDGTINGQPVDTQYQYSTLDDAVNRIKELELELDAANSSTSNDAATIADLQSQIEALSVYRDEQAAFEAEREKFYEEVVFSDEAPDIEEYRDYYESIDPENAEIIYRQVVEQLAYDSEIEDYANTYASMKPKEAAAIFDTMETNLNLVADILLNMDTQSRADILGKMNSDIAAQVTALMEPAQQ